MRSFSWHSRVLPLTMTVIALLFAEKAVALVREVVVTDPIQTSSSATATPMLPSVQLLPISASAAAETPLPTEASPAELQLLQDLRKRRQSLDEREHRVDQRTEMLQSAEIKLQVKLEELTALQQRLEQVEGLRQKRDSANWSGLVKTYEDMKPRDAAAIFDVLDIPVLLEVLDRMDERKAAAVLAGMLPERARLATQMLAQKRTRQDVVAPLPVTSITPNQHN